MTEPTGEPINPNLHYAERQRAWATAWEQAMRMALDLAPFTRTAPQDPNGGTPWSANPHPQTSPSNTSPDRTPSPDWLSHLTKMDPETKFRPFPTSPTT